MNRSKGKRPALWSGILMLIVAVALPMVALADRDGQGRGRGRDKKEDIFINDHDARDGRFDDRGQGRRGRDHDDRDDRDDDDDRDRDEGRDDRDRRERRRDRRDDRIFNRREIARAALDNGFREGFRAGRDDRANGRRFDFRDHQTFIDATTGFRNEFGNIEFYRRTFREGFRRGYEKGFGNRSERIRRNHARDISGRLFGQP